MDVDVITPGEPMVLFAAQEPRPLEEVEAFTRMTAGAELNVAIGLARLGSRVGYLSRLGEDAFGRCIAATMDHEGIDRRYVTFDGVHATGFMLKARRTDGGDTQIEYFRRGSAASQRAPVDDVPCTAACATRT